MVKEPCLASAKAVSIFIFIFTTSHFYRSNGERGNKQATYHNAHAGKLDNSIGEQESTNELPAAFALELAAGEDDEEGDEGGQLDDGGEGEEKATTAP
jgi:hypothetical protein